MRFDFLFLIKNIILILVLLANSNRQKSDVLKIY